ncbi:hypothetical protein PMI05_01230 [Brevibacillus sp. BC25]|nr:hypothetical protein PMI05_01230 [Brevibacillus sp. BC25]
MNVVLYEAKEQATLKLTDNVKKPSSGYCEILVNRECVPQMKKVMALMVLSLSLVVCVNLMPTDVTYGNKPHIFEVKQNVADPGN